MSEIEFGADFDANLYKIDYLIRILSKYDVDLPLKRQKKSFYVDLVNEHKAYILKRVSNDQKFKKPTTPASANKKKDTDTTIRRTSPRKTPSKTSSDIPSEPIINPSDSDTTVKDKVDFISFKKRAVLESDSDVIFSDENPFQSAKKPKQKIKFKKATDMKAIKVDFTEQDEFNNHKVEQHQSSDLNDTIKGELAPASKTENSKIGKTIQNDGTSQKVTFKATASVKKLVSSKKVSNKKIEPNSSKKDNEMDAKPPVEVLSENTDEKIFVDYTPEKLGTPAKKSLKDRLLARKRAKQQSKIPKKLLAGLMSVLTLVFAFWLQFDQPKLHYCSDANQSLDQNQSRQSNSSNGIYLSFLPNCVDCPKNSICSDRQVVSCVSNDYRLKRNTLEKFLPGVLFPFPLGQPTCVLDSFRILSESKKLKQTQHLIKVIDEIVREYIGNLECSRNTLGKDLEWVFSTKPPHLPLGIPVTIAKKRLREMIDQKWNDAMFEDYWNVLLDVIFHPEEDIPVYTVVDDTDFKHRLFASKNNPIVPFSCKVQKRIWKFAQNFAKELVLFITVLLGGLYLNNMYQTREWEQRIVEVLVDDILECIHEEWSFYQKDSIGHKIPGLSTTQLYDHFLPNTKPKKDQEFEIDHAGRNVWFISKDYRASIWDKVRSEILRNSNVRETSMNIKGEPQICWLWIGSHATTPLKRRNSFKTFGKVEKKVVLLNE